MACTSSSQCTAMTTDCQKPACTNGICGVDYTSAGTAVAKQTSGDCQKVVCDGQGNPMPQEDDSDLPTPADDCTTGTCVAGVPTFPLKAKGSTCHTGGGTLCTTAGQCVQCLSASDCPGMSCNATNMCVAAQCNDKAKNGTETDVDCGGGGCPGCAFGKACQDDADCASLVCTGNFCAASCSDGVKDGQETDLDCGGPTCVKCPTNNGCGSDADCLSGRCTAGACVDVLFISQVQTRGDAGGNDDFVELYNPTDAPVTFDVTWTVKARSALPGTTCTTNSLATRFSGTGQIIPPHGHILAANVSMPPYNGTTTPDITYTTGIPDAGTVVLLHGNVVLDQVCFEFDAGTLSTLTTCSASYYCPGTPLYNPHNNMSATNADASLERKPGGAGGNMVNTGDNASDFAVNTTHAPRNLASAPVP